MKPDAFYCAARALALSDIGLSADVALADAPKMDSERAEAMLLNGGALKHLPSVSYDIEAEMYPRCAGLAAATHAVDLGVAEADSSFDVAAIVETGRYFRAFSDATSEHEARQRSDAAHERAKSLVLRRWHAIKQIAEAINRRGRLSGDQVSALARG